MIRTRKGKTKVKGKINEILADYAVITRSVIEMLVGCGFTREDAKREVAEAHRMGGLTEQEFIDEQMETVRETMMNIVAKMSDKNEDGGEADE